MRALETSRFHYIDAPEPELYDLQNDPEERQNIATHQPATLAVFRDQLRKRINVGPSKTQTGSSALSSEQVEKLRALGYFAYHAHVSGEAMSGLADPKSKLWEFNAVLKAGDAFRVNDFSTGEELLNRVRESDPQMYAVPYMLGEAALRQQKWEEAAKELQEALKINPDFDQAMTALARALHGKGDDSGASEWLQKALARNSSNFRAWYELGWIKQRSGDYRSAESSFHKALEIQPNFALAQRDLGLIYFNAKNYAEAVPYLSKAGDLGLQDAELFNFLGICYARTGQLSRAIQSYQKALKIQPKLAEAHLNLGLAYEREARSEAAAREYQSACALNQDLCRYVSPNK